jgi:hypothetical protein
MEARLTFILPEEQIEFNRANQSLNMACALFDILQLRKSLEHIFENSHNTNNDVFDGIDAYAKRISDILENYNINIDKLIE